ncbi:hypothetical protein GCM10008018_29030 [Paenibacillus marchantiophytorum]|uniref:Uncharacterized protein n=1 Tax=Paenibacillus marchantiophytorum TaxID=1619310 RepID=A0ABQ1EQC3_9BACL|nr:hypothetical protein [Paenibacillus marchantiophytorum]GFZ81489.1 hypothetical protein GCM10008018_29030 [Paenibacillus marchantiophytorum]
MNRLKRKVMMVSLSLSTCLVIGTAYAYSDVSTPLQNWYKTRSQQGMSEINIKAQQELTVAGQSLKASAQDKISKTTANLNKMADDTSHRTIDHIEAVNQAYVSQIERSAKELVETRAATDFDKYVSTSKSNHEREVDQLAAETILELTSKLGK